MSNSCTRANFATVGRGAPFHQGRVHRVAKTRPGPSAFRTVRLPALAISTHEDLRGATLIHIDGRRRPRLQPDWARWCALAGISGVDTQVGSHFPDSILAVQAAIAGQGIVLASRILVSDALAAGLLKTPYPKTLAADAYHFVCAPEHEHRAEFAALRNWFLTALRPLNS